MGRKGSIKVMIPGPHSFASIPLPTPLPLRFRGTTACVIAGFGGLVRAVVPDGSEWRRAAISP